MKLSEFRVRAGSWPENLQVFMQIIGQNQIVRHAQAMRLHGVVRPVVVSTNFFVIAHFGQASSRVHILHGLVALPTYPMVAKLFFSVFLDIERSQVYCLQKQFVIIWSFITIV